jgi:hypothetical protein
MDNITLFHNATMTGDLDTVQNMLNIEFGIISMEDISKGFINACKYDHLHIVEWLYKNHDIYSTANITNYNIWWFKLSCYKGQLHIAKRLYEIRPDILIGTNNIDSFMLTCNRGHLDVAKWLYEMCPSITTSGDMECAFRNVCWYGYLNIAKWLYEICPTINISANDDYAFKITCENGHLDLAKWLYEICPTINISAENDYAFWKACQLRRLNLAEWLCELNSKYYVEIVDNKIIDWFTNKTMVVNQTKQIFITEPIKCQRCKIEDVNIQTNCGHSYCLNCMTKQYKKSNINCPYCDEQINDLYQIVVKIE